MKNFCKESKIIALVSGALAIIILIVGAIVSFGDKKLYSDAIYLMKLNSTRIIRGDKAMCKFEPEGSGLYEFTIESDSIARVYLMERNSQKDFDNEEFLRNNRLGESDYVKWDCWLTSGETYYIYLVSVYNQDTRFSIEITE